MFLNREAVKAAAPFLTPLVRAWHRRLTDWRSRASYVSRHAAFLRPDVFDRVFFDNRGNHPTQHIRTTRRFAQIAGAHVLVVGCRHGRELPLWLTQGARSVTALDYIPRPNVWEPFRKPAGAVRFLGGDARRLPFKNDTFDIVSSEALLEHVRQPDLAIAEFHRVVKPGGLVYSIFGPLYFTAGGAHYEGGGPHHERAYEHLLQSRDEFVTWLRARTNPGDEEGLSYLDAGMFSEWTADEYLREFRKYDLVYSAVLLSPEAREFRRYHPAAWTRLRATYSERDLLITGLAFWSRKWSDVSTGRR